MHGLGSPVLVLYSKDPELCCVPTVPLLWSLCSPTGTGHVFVCASIPLESSLGCGQPAKGESVLIVTLISEDSCPDAQGQVDLRSKEMDFEKYFWGILEFQCKCRPFSEGLQSLYSPWTMSFMKLQLHKKICCDFLLCRLDGDPCLDSDGCDYQMTVSWSKVTWEYGRGAMAAQGRIGSGDTEVVGKSVKGLNDSDKWHKALPHLFLKNCCFPREESCSEFLCSSPCWNALLWKAEYSQCSVRQLASSWAGLFHRRTHSVALRAVLGWFSWLRSGALSLELHSALAWCQLKCLELLEYHRGVLQSIRKGSCSHSVEAAQPWRIVCVTWHMSVSVGGNVYLPRHHALRQYFFLL